MIARLMRVNFLANRKTNIGKLRLSCWKTIQIMDIGRFQSSNFTSKLKGVSNNKIVERAGRTNRDMKQATTEAKRRSKLQLENGELSLCLNVNIRMAFIFKLLLIFFYSFIYL